MNDLPIEVQIFILTTDHQTIIKGHQLNRLFKNLLLYHHSLLIYNLPITKYEKDNWINTYKSITLFDRDYSDHYSLTGGFKLIKIGIVAYEYKNSNTPLSVMKLMARYLTPSLIIQVEILYSRGLNKDEIYVYVNNYIDSQEDKYAIIWQNLHYVGYNFAIDKNLYDDQYNKLMYALNLI